MTNMSHLPFEVQGMDLLPQRHSMSCWYASARMLLNWKEKQTGPQIRCEIPAELDKQSLNIRDANTGVGNKEILKLAKRLGLAAIPPMSVEPNQINAWLREYGPLWVNGTRHIVVIAGERNGDVKVYDPWPPNRGKIDWRSYNDWYEGDSSASRRDTSGSAELVFLHCRKNAPFEFT